MKLFKPTIIIRMTITLFIIAYLLGSVNSALIICKVMKLPSPRDSGSKNPGATNVLRIGGKKAAALTFAGDVIKGMIPVIIGHYLLLSNANLCWIGAFAVIGHIYPIFFGLKGGKGVATFIGVCFAITPLLGAAVGLTWLLVALTLRYSSLASIIAIALSPSYAYYFLGEASAIPFMVVALLIIIKHKDNITRLMKHAEHKIGNKK